MIKPQEYLVAGQAGTAALVDVAALVEMFPNTLNIRGTGSSEPVIVRLPYKFKMAVPNSHGGSVTLPSAATDGTYAADTDHSVTVNMPTNRFAVISITRIYDHQ